MIKKQTQYSNPIEKQAFLKYKKQCKLCSLYKAKQVACGVGTLASLVGSVVAIITVPGQLLKLTSFIGIMSLGCLSSWQFSKAGLQYNATHADKEDALKEYKRYIPQEKTEREK